MTKKVRGFRIEEIEETETAIWLRDQLQRIGAFLQANGGDDEMFEALDQRWLGLSEQFRVFC